MYQDTDGMDLDTLRYWLYKLQLPSADAQVAMTYIQVGNLDSATNIISRIYTKYSLTSDESTQLNSLDTVLLNVVTPNFQIGDTVPQPEMTQLDSNFIQELNTYVAPDSLHLLGTTEVRSLLNILYQANYFTPPVVPTDTSDHQLRALWVPSAKQSNPRRQTYRCPQKASRQA